MTVKQGMIRIEQFSFYQRSDVIFRALIYTYVLSLPENFGLVLDTLLYIIQHLISLHTVRGDNVTIPDAV